MPPGLRRGRLRTRSDTFRIEAWGGGPTPAGRVLTAVVERRAEAGQIEVVPLLWRWSEASRPLAPPAQSREAKVSP
jgi:hypothetical protein